MARRGVITLTDDNFAKVVLSDGPVLVDFWARWCIPCLVLKPIIRRISADFRGRITVASLNVDDLPEVCKVLEIRSIPTLVIFMRGQPMERLVGTASQRQIRAMVRRHLMQKPPERRQSKTAPAPNADGGRR